MRFMFKNAESFNQPIGNWVVSEVTDMQFMFAYAESFDQPIGNWDVSKVVDTKAMFGFAISFNQPIGNWDVSSVTDMELMFAAAFSFNQPIEKWDVSGSISDKFESRGSSVESFREYISIWETSNVTGTNGNANRQLRRVDDATRAEF